MQGEAIPAVRSIHPRRMRVNQGPTSPLTIVPIYVKDIGLHAQGKAARWPYPAEPMRHGSMPPF